MSGHSQRPQLSRASDQTSRTGPSSGLTERERRDERQARAMVRFDSFIDDVQTGISTGNNYYRLLMLERERKRKGPLEQKPPTDVREFRERKEG